MFEARRCLSVLWLRNSCYEEYSSHLYLFVFIPVNWATLGSDSKLQFLFLSTEENRVIPSIANVITWHDFFSFC